MPAKFYYHPRLLEYDFGSRHPLKPERLRRTVELLGRYGVKPTDAGKGLEADALRVHSSAYLSAVRGLSNRIHDHATAIERDEWRRQGWDFGFGSPDNPPFSGMWEASLAYMAGSASAAQDVRKGASLAFNLSGGLHHAQHSRASGFCILNDPAVAIDILLERFDRVAYVDIDLHHGDGVQWIWFEDPRVFTYSIHQDPRSFFPGTGFVEETGNGFTSMNVPLEPGTTGEVWRWAFDRTAMPAFEAFRPQAIVLQMGTDPHFDDPLGHLKVSAQDWLQAVIRVRDLGLPVVALGGGGYNLTTVPRMWTAAVLTLMNRGFDDDVPGDLAHEWNMPRFFDFDPPRGGGLATAEAVVEWHQSTFLPNIGKDVGAAS